MFKFVSLFILLSLSLPLPCFATKQIETLDGYRNLKWDTPLNSDFTNCIPSQVFQLKQNILACKYKYDDKTYGYVDNAQVSYLFYDKKLIAVQIGIFNEILDSQIITNKYGKPQSSYSTLATWKVGNTYIEYVATGGRRNKLTNEVDVPRFTSIKYINQPKYKELTEKRSGQIYNNI